MEILDQLVLLEMQVQLAILDLQDLLDLPETLVILLFLEINHNTRVVQVATLDLVELQEMVVLLELQEMVEVLVIPEDLVITAILEIQEIME